MQYSTNTQTTKAYKHHIDVFEIKEKSLLDLLDFVETDTREVAAELVDGDAGEGFHNLWDIDSSGKAVLSEILKKRVNRPTKSLCNNCC